MSDRCLECDFDYDSVTAVNAPDSLRAFPPRYRDALVGEHIRVKPSPWSWSALEYVCHLRDVLAVYVGRVLLVAAEDQPPMHGMERDGLAIRERYNEQDPAVALDELAVNTDELAALLASLTPDEWSRTGMHAVRGEQTIVWMAANCVHEGRHHLMDVARVLALVGR